jgi:hypothetical protein
MFSHQPNRFAVNGLGASFVNGLERGVIRALQGCDCQSKDAVD